MKSLELEVMLKRTLTISFKFNLLSYSKKIVIPLQSNPSVMIHSNLFNTFNEHLPLIHRCTSTKNFLMKPWNHLLLRVKFLQTKPILNFSGKRLISTKVRGVTQWFLKVLARPKTSICLKTVYLWLKVIRNCQLCR